MTQQISYRKSEYRAKVEWITPQIMFEFMLRLNLEFFAFYL